jgi:hypothetical protein
MFRCKDIAEAFRLSKRPGSYLSPRGTGCYWLLRRFASLIYFASTRRFRVVDFRAASTNFRCARAVSKISRSSIQAAPFSAKSPDREGALALADHLAVDRHEELIRRAMSWPDPLADQLARVLKR